MNWMWILLPVMGMVLLINVAANVSLRADLEAKEAEIRVLRAEIDQLREFIAAKETA